MKLKIYEAGEQLNRIANALEEILRLVKLDQEKMAKRYPDETDPE
jgi:ABC-type proline/glycine betaine transport system ATPase subunit